MMLKNLQYEVSKTIEIFDERHLPPLGFLRIYYLVPLFFRSFIVHVSFLGIS